MKISIQTLFDEYEETTIELQQEANSEQIMKKTMQKLPKTGKRRTLLTAICVAAAVVVLCGAAAITQLFTVADGSRLYSTGRAETPVISWNNGIRIDTEGRTQGKVCGLQFGWLPEGKGVGFTCSTYENLEAEAAQQAAAMTPEEQAQARELVYYTFDRYDGEQGQTEYSITCYSANSVANKEFLCGGTRTEVVKDGTVGSFDAMWIKTCWQRADTGEETSWPLLLLYDREKVCLVVISADWAVGERIAENLTIVPTAADTPAPKADEAEYLWIGGVG